MTSKAALCKALLDGKVLNIMNGFKLLGITNIPREIGRSVERAFGVTVSRVEMNGTSRYGQHCNWINYRLNRTDYNKEGIEKMEAYIKDQSEVEASFTPTERGIQDLFNDPNERNDDFAQSRQGNLF